MFTWICPKCGREVPPAYDDCPDCAPKPSRAPAAEPAPPLTQEPLPPPATPPEPVPYVPPPPAPSPAPARVSSAPNAERPPKPLGAVLPTWLLTLVFLLAFLGIGAGVYWLVGGMRGGKPAERSARVEGSAANPDAQSNPFQRFVEVSGVRFKDDAKRKAAIRVAFVVTNHSEALMSGLAGTVTIWSRTAKSEEEMQGTFTFKTDLKPFESKEIESAFDTKLKIYELADWPNATADVVITAPGGASQGSR
jgi:hypothetical protein